MAAGLATRCGVLADRDYEGGRGLNGESLSLAKGSIDFGVLDRATDILDRALDAPGGKLDRSSVIKGTN